MKKHTVLVALLIFSLCLSGCGYRVGSLLPADLKTINVHMFKNRTSEPDLSAIVTNGIIQEIIYDGTLQVTEDDDADTLLIGEIVDYRREPLRYSSSEVTTEYRLRIAVRFKFLDVQNEKIIAKSSKTYGETTFFVAGSLPEAEQAALPAAIEDLAHEVVELLVEGGW